MDLLIQKAPAFGEELIGTIWKEQMKSAFNYIDLYS